GRTADERHAHAFGRREVPEELLEEEARVRVPGGDAQEATRLRAGIRGRHADQVPVRRARRQIEPARRRRGAVTGWRGAAGVEDLLLDRGERRARRRTRSRLRTRGVRLARRTADQRERLPRPLAEPLQLDRQTALG